MSKIQLSPTDAVALLAVIGLTVGVALVHGVGWALIVISMLVLVYLVMPDRGTTP